MKLLLTSGGIRNKSLANALVELLGKPTAESNILFIPTAMNAEDGDKGWVIDELIELQKLGWKQLDMLDICGLDKDALRARVEIADVIYMNGGNTYYLMNKLNESGFAEILQDLKDQKVYIGSSAGSMVASSRSVRETTSPFDEVEANEFAATTKPLNWVDFYFVPHYKSDYMTEDIDSWLAEKTGKFDFKIYALDDQSAIKVVDDDIQVVSEGTWKMI